MGLFFNLFIETGNNEKDNKELKQYFLSIGKIVTVLGSYNLKVESLNNNFGITVSVFSLIPIVNFLVMPVAVCGATAYWVAELKEQV